ncbi:BREX system serine/threonine kinase PglW [Rothia sp. ARF10]|nr:BREX system serine/threonine kinase PglW [Rothia sp. ARF10]
MEVSPSQFTHETEGLALIRVIMPDESPYRAWSNFEFRDNHGKWHEVDLLLLGRGQFHLIELKYYSGTLRGDDHRWLRDGRRAEDSPLKLARRKAQYFATKLKDELRAWAAETGAQIPDEREVIPFVQESVFLHHDRFRCELSEASARGLYGLDGHEDSSNLPPISELVLQPPHRRAIGANQELILAKLLKRIGLVQRRERTAGSWVIQDQALAEGDGWQDWLASHQVAHQERARIRFQVTPTGAPDSERERIRKVAEHEFRVMSRLQHDGLLAPRDFVESDLGVGLVYDYDDSWQPLDLWVAAQTNGVPLDTQLSILRQVGEAVQYAHRNKVVHRELTPRAIWVRDLPGADGDVKVKVGDWQGSGIIDAANLTRNVGTGVTSLMRARVADPHGDAAAGTEGDRWLTEAFIAPEGAWNAAADRVRLDVFGLGALTFYLVAGKPAADTTQALGTRLREQSGLDLSVDIPQVTPALRTLVLKATNPAPAQRTGDVGAFLLGLGEVERQAADADVSDEDPLDATPGSLLGGRFRLERRLGQGSTAVGLLVTDLQAGTAAAPAQAERVLKVALHDDAASRLADEAEVLRSLDHPRLVRLVDGPVTVGGRAALLLESAGTETLAEALRGRDRLSIDLLQRYGTDLLDALVALDRGGIDHRDIKPSNLGVRENRGDRTKHLVLFDFSLTKAAASATSAGTPPYLDPFLTGRRDRWDSAAERYAAAVVLYEMASGRTPVYGEDPDANPAAVSDEALIPTDAFDPNLSVHLVEFFTTALARDSAARHHTAEEMRTAWLSIFATDATTEPDESADRLAAAATLATPLRESGLTARALSALEPYAVATVQDLLTVDPVRLSRLQGVANATRLQISARIKEWRARLGDVAAPKHRSDQDRLTVEGAAELLLRVAAERGRSKNRAGVVRLILGVGTDLDAFATQSQLAANLPDRVTAARVSTLVGTLQEAWAAERESRDLLEQLAQSVNQRLVDLGGVATVTELTDAIHETLAPAARDSRDERLLQGLLRLAVDRLRALDRAEAATQGIAWRRRGSTVVALAHDPSLLDVAESLGRDADQLVARVGTTDAIVPPKRAGQQLTQTLADSADVVPANLRDAARLVRLAAGLSTSAAASGANELYHRDLSQVSALTHAFEGYGGQQALTPKELRERVEARFPTLARLPERPRLDELVAEAQLGLVFDDSQGVYRSQQGRGDTTGLQSRMPTTMARGTRPVEPTGVVGHRLDQSVQSRSFLALGVPAVRTSRLVAALESRYAAQVVDLTGVLIDGLRTNAEQAGISWDLVRAADAEPTGSSAARGLRELVRRSWDQVATAIDEALTSGGDSPVVIVEASPLARYDNMQLLARWTDLGSSRARAVWLVVPQLAANQGATLDGRPVPLASPGQYVALDAEDVDELGPMHVAGAAQEEN